MYLLPIVVPIFMEGDRRLVASDWKRALMLLRDSLGGRYGDLVVAAPSLPAEGASEQTLETIGSGEGIRLEPTVDGRLRARTFWRELPRFRARVAALLDGAQVVHGGIDELFRPIVELPLAMAFARKLPVVFVQDTDIIVQLRALGGEGRAARLRTMTYSAVLERACRATVARADLSLLKGRALMQRYARRARNAREFHDTSYLLSEIASEAGIAARVATLQMRRPLRFVYCGRLVARKGVAKSVAIVAAARAAGADVTLEIIGSGPDEAALRAQVERAALTGAVTFAGSLPYGAPLLQRLATYDALLFTPTAEDTPRMIFDGYAAGLPLFGSGIPYVHERIDEEGAGIVLPDSVEEAAARIAEFHRNRSLLMPLTTAAVRAGRHHAADAWYRRRAEWTFEAVEKHAS